MAPVCRDAFVWQALAKGLTANKSIENLDMSGNKIGAEGTQATQRLAVLISDCATSVVY